MPLLTNQEVKTRVDEYLLEFFNRKIEASHIYGQSYQGLLQFMKEFILRGGKRLRPYLVYLSYCVASESDDMPAIQALAAIELLHLALLIHDDIIDQDEFRYGGPNIIGYYLRKEGRRTAESIALLAGDIALAMVMELLIDSAAEPATKARVMNMLTTQFHEVLAGQFLDSVPGSHEFNRLDDILLIHRYKTASYTTIGPLKIGLALSENRSAALEQTMAEYGQSLGVLFGLTDDLIGMFGDENVSGKPNCSDLHEAKPTVLFSYAKQRLRGGDMALFTSLLGLPHKRGENLNKLRVALEESGAKSKTEELAQGYSKKAVEAVAGLRGSAADALKALPETILTRKR